MAREQDSLNRPSYGTASTTGTATAVPAGASSDQIRQNIDRTRAEMDSTVDALGNRLQPRHLLDEVLEYFNKKGGTGATGSTAGASQSLRDGATGVLERVKDHPMPALLIGAGVAWMLFEGDKTSRTRLSRWDRGGREGDIGNWRNLPEHGGSVVDARTGQPYTEGYGSEYRGPTSGESAGVGSGIGFGGIGSGGGYTASGQTSSGSGGPGLASKAKDALASAGSAISGAASSVKDGVTGAIGSTGHAASSMGSSAGSYARSAGQSAYGYGGMGYDMAGRGFGATRNGLATALEEYPLMSGVAALAVGAVAGLLLPATRRENELMGQYSDQLKDQAQQAGQQFYSQGKAVAQAATSAVTDAAGESGVAPGSLAEKARTVVRDVGNAVSQSAGQLVEDVKRVAQDATTAATDSARREGLQPGQLKDTAKDIANRAAEAAKDEAQRQKDGTSR